MLAWYLAVLRVGREDNARIPWDAASPLSDTIPWEGNVSPLKEGNGSGMG